MIAPLIRLQAGDVSKAVRRRYIARVKNAQKAIGRLEKGATRALLADLQQARRAILGSLAGATEFGTWNAQHAIAATEEAMAHYVQTGTATLRNSFNSAWTLGTERVAKAAQTVGIEVDLPNFQFGINRGQLDFAQGWAGDLIQAESDSILRGVSREVRLAFAGGQTREQLIQRVHKNITKPLRFGTRRKRAETIVRTEVNRIHNAAGQAAREKMGAENVKVRKQWLHTGAGKVPRADHLALDGVTVDVDEPFPYPGLPKSQWPMYPLDPVLPAEASINCFLPGTVVSGQVVAATRSFYAGQAVEIVLRDGRRLAVTPNHPVLSEHGFVPAGSVHEGQHLLGYLGERDSPERRFRIEDKDHEPSKVEEVFSALSLAQVPEQRLAGVLDFHGDGLSVKGKIEIVRADRVLLDDGNASGFEQGGESVFLSEASELTLEHGQRPLDFCLSGLGRPSDGIPCGSTLALDKSAVALHANPPQALRIGVAANIHANALHVLGEDVPPDVRLFRELVHGHPGEVSLDEVVEVRHFDFCGHVYDLQSPFGWIVAQGIVNSNCHCAVIEIFEILDENEVAADLAGVIA